MIVDQRVMTPDGPGRVRRLSRDGKDALVAVDADGLKLVNQYAVADLTDMPEPDAVPVALSDDEARALQNILSELPSTDIHRFVVEANLDHGTRVLEKLNASLGPPPSRPRVRRVRP